MHYNTNPMCQRMKHISIKMRCKTQLCQNTKGHTSSTLVHNSNKKRYLRCSKYRNALTHF